SLNFPGILFGERRGSPECQQILVKPVNLLICLSFSEVQLTPVKSLLFSTVGDTTGDMGLRIGGKLLEKTDAPTADRFLKLLFMVDEKKKGSMTSELLSHEKHGRLRGQKKKRGHGTISVLAGNIIKPPSGGGVGDL